MKGMVTLASGAASMETRPCMCLILLAHDVHPDFPLVLAANRDEFLDRPTRPLGLWADQAILGGRDLTAGGTWLGVSPDGRIAAVTNVREPGRQRKDLASRGDLVVGMLTHPEGPNAYLEAVEPERYNGFNAVAFHEGQGIFHSNRPSESRPRSLAPGFHGLSNASLDTPWPKVVSGTEGLRSVVEHLTFERPDPVPFFDLLADEHQAADAQLPQTGVGLELERVLSARFIRTAGYGTRSSSVILVRRDGSCFFHERTYPPRGGQLEDRFHKQTIGSAVAT